MNRSGWSTPTKCPAPGKTSSLPSSALLRQLARLVDRDELVLGLRRRRAAGRRRSRDAREIQPVAHRLLRDREMLEDRHRAPRVEGCSPARSSAISSCRNLRRSNESASAREATSAIPTIALGRPPSERERAVPAHRRPDRDERPVDLAQELRRPVVDRRPAAVEVRRIAHRSPRCGARSPARPTSAPRRASRGGAGSSRALDPHRAVELGRIRPPVSRRPRSQRLRPARRGARVQGAGRPATGPCARPADRVRLRSGESRDDRRIRRQPDDVAGRKRAVELGHREVLVRRSALARRGSSARAPRARRRAARSRRPSCRKARAQVGGASRDSGRRRRRRPRSSRPRGAATSEPREPPGSRGTNWRTACSTALRSSDWMWIEPNDAASWLPSLSSEVGDRAGHDHDLVLQPPPRVERARDLVRGQHVEVEMLDADRAERREHLTHELRADAATGARRA